MKEIDVSGNTKIIEIERWFSEALDNAWVTDEKQAEVLHEIMTKANKLIPTKDEWIMYTPDWSARLWALKLSLQAKWHLSPKEKKNDSFDWKIFIFSKS